MSQTLVTMPAPLKTGDAGMNGAPIKVRLSGAQKTMLGTLRVRAEDTKSPKPILGDPYALSTIDAIDVDWEELDPFGMSQFLIKAVAGRAKQLDTWTREFLAQHEEATVLHLACGLDSRCLRIQWQKPKVRWIDVDMPDVAKVRRKLPLAPTSGDYTLLGTSVTDATWLEESVPNDRPTLVIMEGLIMYLPTPHGNLLLHRIASHFTHGGQMIFDTAGKGIVRLVQLSELISRNSLGIILGWSLEDPKHIEQVHPKFKLLEGTRTFWVQSQDSTVFWLVSVLLGLLSWIPFMGGLVGHMLRVEF
jgi:O-methyltransferase involved in polyketide biosynthesis